ncbi:MAG: hypothetical protein ACK5YE_23680, partial [Planctomyces sp.]
LIRMLAESRSRMSADFVLPRKLDLAEPHSDHHPEDTRLAGSQISAGSQNWWYRLMGQKALRRLKRTIWK